jgi:predicted small lipoprotein YifL
MRIVVVLALMALAACGAEGDTITPSANVGLNIGPDGVTPQASAGITAGILSLGINL